MGTVKSFLTRVVGLLKLYTLLGIGGAALFSVVLLASQVSAGAIVGITLGIFAGLYLVIRKVHCSVVCKDPVFQRYSVHPPAVAEYFFYLATPAKYRQELLVELRDDFVNAADDRGLGMADVWYWNRFVGSIFSFLFNKLRSRINGTEIRPSFSRYMKKK